MTDTSRGIDLIPTTPGEVAKAIAFLVAALATFLSTALTDNHLTELELLQGGVVLVGVFPVYFVTGRIPKTAAAVATTVLQGVIVIVAGGTGLAAISVSNWLVVLVTGLGAAGVLLIPNAPKPGPLAVVATASPLQAQDVQDAIDARKVAERGKP